MEDKIKELNDEIRKKALWLIQHVSSNLDGKILFVRGDKFHDVDRKKILEELKNMKITVTNDGEKQNDTPAVLVGDFIHEEDCIDAIHKIMSAQKDIEKLFNQEFPILNDVKQ